MGGSRFASAALQTATNQNLEDPELRTIISDYGRILTAPTFT